MVVQAAVPVLLVVMARFMYIITVNTHFLLVPAVVADALCPEAEAQVVITVLAAALVAVRVVAVVTETTLKVALRVLAVLAARLAATLRPLTVLVVGVGEHPGELPPHLVHPEAQVVLQLR
jgi:hypothetical protein